MRTKKPEIGQRCESCHMILKSSINNIKKIVCNRGDKYHRAETISFLPILTALDVTFIENFNSRSLPGTDCFINKFIAIYKDKSNDDFKNSLVVCLLKAFVAKMSGESLSFLIFTTPCMPTIFNMYQKVAVPTMAVICGRPHTINEQSDFGDMVVKAAVQCSDTVQKQETDVVLLNTAVDGVSCESHFCRWQISSFLQGESNMLGLVDPNHTAKNS
eukprot:scaffold26027_cov70-Attheya_sp.AAC.8